MSLLTPFYDGNAPPGLETGGALLFRLAVATLLLLVPTALMGATFPLVVEWQSARDGGRGGVATLYAVKTLGGAAGAWASAFVLLPLLGITYTLAAAALGNFAAALPALSLRTASRGESVEITPRHGDDPDEVEPPAEGPEIPVSRAALRAARAAPRWVGSSPPTPSAPSWGRSLPGSYSSRGSACTTL